VPTLVTTVAAGPDSELPAAELAAKYGLTEAGARPGLIDYTRQVWAYRHFVTHYATAGMVASFSKARLGRLWQVLTPLFNAAVYYLIFGIILDTRHNVHNFIAYLCCGIFLFNSTRATVMDGVVAITRNLGLIRALHFPRACLPLATTVGGFKDLIASMIVMVGIALGTGEPVTVTWLLMIPVLALQFVMNAGLALFMARLGNKIVDLKQLLPFIIRTWMYSSGVMYSVELFAKHLPHLVAKIIVIANPMVVYIQLARQALLTQTPYLMPTAHLWIIAAAWAIVALVVGYVYFWLGEQEYGRG
jgi:teichoic acid transport system permease protein